jgi:hypothetical protein
MRDGERLIARIRQLRRAAGASPTTSATDVAGTERLAAIETRLAHLEQLVEGLQDSVHRESARQGKLIADIQAQVSPESMAAALSKDARDRGL